MDAIRVLETFESASGWTILSDSTENLAVSTTRAEGTNSLEFDKKSAGETYAGAYRTVDFNFRDWLWYPNDWLCWEVFVSATTNVSSAFVRLGFDATNYAEFRFTGGSLLAGGFRWCHVRLGDFITALKGLNRADINYLAVGLNFSAAANTLADIKFDNLYLLKAGAINTGS